MEYPMSFELKPGVNKLDKIRLHYRSFLISAHASIPMDLNIDIKPNSVIYLGHMDIVIRPKQNDDEQSAGSPFPLIDQATAGFSNGTYDVIIRDNYDEDMKRFISEYPLLGKVKVEKNILPQWIRPEKRKN
jgi:hypothetical protein